LNLPLADVLRPGFDEDLLAAVDSITYAGQEQVGAVACHKLAFMNGEVKGYFWIEADEATPRPRKIDILYYTHPGKPRYQVVIDSLNAKETLDDKLFVFEPPEGATRIQMVARDED
jgi:hypothetical protein